MNGKSVTISISDPFALSLSKGELCALAAKFEDHARRSLRLF
jgi:hypothetical protein